MRVDAVGEVAGDGGGFDGAITVVRTPTSGLAIFGFVDCDIGRDRTWASGLRTTSISHVGYSMFIRPPPPGFRGLHPDLPIRVYQRNLPHWRQDGATYFVTFRLAEALPQEKLQFLQRLKAEWERTSPQPRKIGRTTLGKSPTLSKDGRMKATASVGSAQLVGPTSFTSDCCTFMGSTTRSAAMSL